LPLIQGVAEIDDDLGGVSETDETVTGIFDLKGGIGKAGNDAKRTKIALSIAALSGGPCV
jgi:hypothetical protein